MEMSPAKSPFFLQRVIGAVVKMTKKIHVSFDKRLKKKIRLPNFDSRNFYEPSKEEESSVASSFLR